MPLIDLEKAKKILNTTDDKEALEMCAAVEQMIEGYLGFKLIKTNFTGEKITLPYGMSKIFKPINLPVNSISKMSLLGPDGGYHEFLGKTVCGKYGVELLANFNNVNIDYSQWRALLKPSILPAKISAVELDYNAGLYDDYTQVPAIIKKAAEMLLAYLSDEQINSGAYQSETMGSYSYSRGQMVNGIPPGIAAMLSAVVL